MDLKASTRTIYDMLNEKKSYIVPRFKRGYTWTINEVMEFWKDISSSISLSGTSLVTRELFIGSIVLIDEGSQKDILIIDGHQRLVTVTVLFAALIESFKESGYLKAAASLQEMIINKQRHYKIQNEIPCTFLQKAIQAYDKTPVFPESEEDKNIKNAYDFFINIFSNFSPCDLFKDHSIKECPVKEVEFLEAVRDQVLKLVMICISVTNEDDAYTILGTLNAKVPNLTPVDFIKNEVVRVLNPRGLSFQAEEKWGELHRLLHSREEKHSLEIFFMQYWPSRYEYTPLEKYYTSFKQKVAQNPLGLSQFMDNLLIAAKDYVVISDPLPSDFRQQEEREIYSALQSLELFRAHSAKILLLALFEIRRKNLIALNDLNKIMNMLVNFHFIASAVCSANITNLERIYSKKAIAFRKSSSIKESKDILYSLSKELDDFLPDFDTFKSALSEIYFLDGKPRYKKLIQYIFKKWESYLIATNELEMAEITIEHILPQSTNHPYVGMLGNLLPLAGQLNHTAGDKDYTTKLYLYKKSQFKTVIQFVDKYSNKEDWTEHDILQRTNDIAKLLYYEIFRVKG